MDNRLRVQTNLDKQRYHTSAWKPCKGSKLETMTTPKKHIDFAKDNLAHIAATKNDVKNENEVKDEDGE